MFKIIVNGRRKGAITIPATVTGNEEALLRSVRESKIGHDFLRDRTVKKVHIAKHGRLVSFVTEP